MATLDNDNQDKIHLRQLTIKTKPYQFKTILSNTCKIDFDSAP